MNLVEQYAKSARKLANAVGKVDKRIRQLDQTIARKTMEQEDLLHLLELDRFNAAEGYEITRQLKKVRQERRNAKNEKMVLMEIKSMANNNTRFDTHVHKLHEVIERKMNEVNNQRYRLKIRTDLKQRFERIHERERIERMK